MTAIENKTDEWLGGVKKWVKNEGRVAINEAPQ